MEYPAIILDKARRLEQLLQKITAGESLDEANEAFGFSLDQRQLARWQARYEAGGCQWEALIDGRQGHPRTASSAVREWLYARKEEDEAPRAPQLAIEIKEQFGVDLSAGHINHLLRKRGLTSPPGRPYKKQPAAEEAPATPSAPGESVDNAGLFFP